MAFPCGYNTCTLRKFHSDDLGQVASLASRCFRERYTLDFFLGMWRIASDTFLVADFQGIIQGFILGVQTDIDAGRVLMLAVAEGCRGKGLGGSLLKMLMEQLPEKVERVFLEVRTDNLAAIAFYRHHGFQATGSLPQFYTDGSDAHVMVKRLHR